MLPDGGRDGWRGGIFTIFFITGLTRGWAFVQTRVSAAADTSIPPAMTATLFQDAGNYPLFDLLHQQPLLLETYLCLLHSSSSFSSSSSYSLSWGRHFEGERNHEETDVSPWTT